VQRLDKRPTHKAVSVGAGGLQSLEEPEMRSKAPSYLRGSDGGISPWSGEIGLAIRTAGVDLPAAGRADPRVIAGIEDAAIICRCWLGINGRSPYLSATPGGVADMAQPPDPRAGGYPQGPAPGYQQGSPGQPGYPPPAGFPPQAYGQQGPPRKKRRVFLWFFLAVQAIFIIWLIVGLSSSTGSVSSQVASACYHHAWYPLFKSQADCVTHYGGALNDAGNVGKGIGAALIVIVWIIVDFCSPSSTASTGWLSGPEWC